MYLAKCTPLRPLPHQMYKCSTARRAYAPMQPCSMTVLRSHPSNAQGTFLPSLFASPFEQPPLSGSGAGLHGPRVQTRAVQPRGGARPVRKYALFTGRPASKYPRGAVAQRNGRSAQCPSRTRPVRKYPHGKTANLLTRETVTLPGSAPQCVRRG